MQQIEPTENQSAALVDAHTDKRIHEHLTNQNDVITEEDIRNVVTTIASDEPQVQEPTSADDAGTEQVALCNAEHIIVI